MQKLYFSQIKWHKLYHSEKSSGFSMNQREPARVSWQTAKYPPGTCHLQAREPDVSSLLGSLRQKVMHKARVGAALMEFLWWVDLSYLSFCRKTVSIASRWTVFFDTQVACVFLIHSCFRCSPFSWPEKTIPTRSGASISCAPPSARTTGLCRSWRSGCSRWNELEEMRQLRWPFAVGRVVGNQGRKGTKGANMIGWLVLES